MGCTTIFNPGWEADPWGSAHAPRTIAGALGRGSGGTASSTASTARAFRFAAARQRDSNHDAGKNPEQAQVARLQNVIDKNLGEDRPEQAEDRVGKR